MNKDRQRIHLGFSEFSMTFQLQFPEKGNGKKNTHTRKTQFSIPPNRLIDFSLIVVVLLVFPSLFSVSLSFFSFLRFHSLLFLFSMFLFQHHKTIDSIDLLNQWKRRKRNE
jgi:hypothetical protein